MTATREAVAPGAPFGHLRPKAPGVSWVPIVVSIATAAALGVAAREAPGTTPLTLPIGPAIITLPAGRFIALYAAGWVACLAAVLTMPGGLRFGRGAALILIAGVACRAAVALSHPPSDDVNRYLWEGRVVAAGFSPYVHAPHDPADAALDSLRAEGDSIWHGVNHPEMRAIYPPLTLLLFAGVASAWYSASAIQLLVLGFDVAALVLLLALLREAGADARWGFLYALNPVVLYAFAGQGHLDAVQACLLLAAMYLYRRRRWAWMFLAAGAAVQVKYVAVFALPFFVRRENLAYAPVAAVAAAVPFLYFVPGDGWAVADSLVRFGSDFAFNGPAHAVGRAAGLDMRSAALVCHASYLAAWIWGLWRFHPTRCTARCDDPVAGIAFAFGTLLVLSPTVHFWYLTWVLPFVALRPAASWIVLSLTVGLGFIAYGNLQNGGDFYLPAWAQLGIWGGPLLLFAREIRLEALRARGEQWRVPRTVSVIIPARNETHRIREAVASARRDACVAEVIVVDGGSIDATPVVASAAGARVVEHRAPFHHGGGRGGQVAAGLRVATGDVVAIVHADTRVPPGALARVVEVLGRNPDVVGGAIGSVFDRPGMVLRAVEIANRFRAVFLGVAFGDQVQFFRRAPILRAGIYPAIPLMEDVELSLRLSRLGRTVFLWGDACVSARRWQERPLARCGLVLRLVATYLVTRLWDRADPVGLYARYYG